MTFGKPVSSSRRQALKAGLAAAALPALLAGCAAPRRVDVAVIGAGLAGLSAALLLERAGLEVRLIEAADRPGGRCLTARDLPDRPALGGALVGHSYAHFRQWAREFEVSLAPPRPSPPMDLAIDGELIAGRDWATHPANPMAGKDRRVPPAALLSHLLRPHNPFGDPRDWLTEQARSADVSIGAFLRAHGVPDAAIALLNVNANNNGLERISVIEELRALTLRAAETGADIVIGGTDRLTDAMAGALSYPPRYGVPVTAIAQPGPRYRLTLGEGDHLEADYVIAALPLPALGRIYFDLSPAPAFIEALGSLAYTRITQVFIDAREPFWQDDGYTAGLWTNGPLERLFPRLDEAGDVIGLRLWANGAGADLIDSMSDAELESFIDVRLGTLRPAAAGKLSVARRHSWQTPTQGGAYHNWRAGSVHRLARALHSPAGRLVLAGEHMSRYHTGLEGALESGEAAADAIARDAGLAL